MPAGFPGCTAGERYRFPGLNVDFGLPDCPSLNLLSFAIGFTLRSFVAGHFWMWFDRYPGRIRGAFETCPRWAPSQDGMPCPSRYGFGHKEFLGSSGGQFVT